MIIGGVIFIIITIHMMCVIIMAIIKMGVIIVFVGTVKTLLGFELLIVL